MLKEGEGVFLDDVTLKELERMAGCPVLVFDSTPKGFYRVLRKVPAIKNYNRPARYCKPRRSYPLFK
jgi:hypothetical protein